MKIFYFSIILFSLLLACNGVKKKEPAQINAGKFLKASDEKLDEGVKLPYSHMSLNLEWTGAMIEDKDYTVWGSSPIMGDDGKVHVFSARWPEFNVDPGWRRTCEVAHYVADQPEGPYTFSDVAVKGTGVDGDWDKFAPHNPEIKKLVIIMPLFSLPTMILHEAFTLPIRRLDWFTPSLYTDHGKRLVITV